MNFDDYVDRFELDNGPIMLYKADADYQTRIKAIKAVLDGYNTQQLKVIDDETSAKDREGQTTEGDAVQRPDVGGDQET
jgi:hypothetical protein